MARIIMSGPQNITLDGIVDDPDGAEGSRRGDWFRRYGGADLEQWTAVALEEALRADAWLLGARSYDFFGSRWRPRTGELAERLTALPKYVVSSTLTEPEWNNTTVLRGDPATEVARLKQEIGGDIVVPGSHTLGRMLIDHHLLDEISMVVFPVVLGEGAGMVDGIGAEQPLRLLEASIIGSGLVHLRYEFVRERS